MICKGDIFYEKGLSEHNVKGLLVVRGISDMANVDKDFSKPFRKPAAQNAALVAKTLMEFFPEFDWIKVGVLGSFLEMFSTITTLAFWYWGKP